MAKEKSGGGSMAALQAGRKGEFPGGEVKGGGPAGAGTPSNSASIDSKFHERPKSSVGSENSFIVNKGDGLSK